MEIVTSIAIVTAAIIIRWPKKSKNETTIVVKRTNISKDVETFIDYHMRNESSPNAVSERQWRDRCGFKGSPYPHERRDFLRYWYDENLSPQCPIWVEEIEKIDSEK